MKQEKTITESTFTNYVLDSYIKDVETNGLEKTWTKICSYALSPFYGSNPLLKIESFGELYEIGLAIQDKILKKKSGQYFTPDDVAYVMSKWLLECKAINVCDVACGTGKLILTYLELLGYNKARELIKSNHLFLYDFDKTALNICKTSIAVKYGIDLLDNIKDIYGDFLDPKIHLPKNCKVIANPPYAGIESIPDYWEKTSVLNDTKEFYSAFMEKIFVQAEEVVIITPFSFISGSKFYSLRKLMCELGNGSIYAFDNVPGNIFCGRKHGIFNTNTANSVRAAITVYKKDKVKGYKVTPLIRFKNEERADLLQCEVLESLLPDTVQLIDSKNKMFQKVHKELDSLFHNWTTKSQFKMKDILSKAKTELMIDMPNTCRYYTTASSRKLSRTGSIVLYFDDESKFDFAYCLINSSFAYWWWRIFDGGITYPISLLNILPLPINLLSEKDKTFFKDTRIKMSAKENSYVITKMNAGVPQENIKFPEEYRNSINQRLIQILGLDLDCNVFDIVHSNRFVDK